MEWFGGPNWAGGIDCGGTSSSLGKVSNLVEDVEAGGVERGEDAVEGGRKRLGEVRGNELNK